MICNCYLRIHAVAKLNIRTPPYTLWYELYPLISAGATEPGVEFSCSYSHFLHTKQISGQ